MPRRFRYSRPKSAPPETLRAYLASKFQYFTEAQWEDQIHAGYLSVNEQQVTDPTMELRQQDCICFSPPPSKEPEVDTTHLQFLYEDDHVLVCCKNGNLPVTEGGRYCEHTLTFYLNEQLRHRMNDNEEETRRRRMEIPNPISHTSDRTTFTCMRKTGGKSDGGEDRREKDEAASSVEHTVEEGSSSVKWQRKFRGNETPFSDADEGGSRLTTLHMEDTEETERNLPRLKPQVLADPVSTSSSSSSWPPFNGVFPIHRLDKETSGVLVFAKSLEVAQDLSALFQAQSTRLTEEVEKRVWGGGLSARDERPQETTRNSIAGGVQHATPLRSLPTDKRALRMSFTPSTVCSSAQGCSCSSVSTPASLSSWSLSSAQFDQIQRSAGEKKVEKTYIAVLAGAAQRENEVHVVVTRIGSMAQDPEWKLHPHHHHLAKLKMVCYPIHTSTPLLVPPTSSFLHGSSNVAAVDRKRETEKETSSTAARHPIAGFTFSSSLSPKGKVAISRITMLTVHRTYQFTVAKIEILTGRTHQIRLHCAHIGFPVLGDKLYQTHTPRVYGGSYAVPDSVYLSRVRSPFIETRVTAGIDSAATPHPFPSSSSSSSPVEMPSLVPLFRCQRHLLHATRLMFIYPERWRKCKNVLSLSSHFPPLFSEHCQHARPSSSSSLSSPFSDASSTSPALHKNGAMAKGKRLPQSENREGHTFPSHSNPLVAQGIQEKQRREEPESGEESASAIHTCTCLADPSYWFLLDVHSDDPLALEALRYDVHKSFIRSFFS